MCTSVSNEHKKVTNVYHSVYRQDLLKLSLIPPSHSQMDSANWNVL